MTYRELMDAIKDMLDHAQKEEIRLEPGDGITRRDITENTVVSVDKDDMGYEYVVIG